MTKIWKGPVPTVELVAKVIAFSFQDALGQNLYWLNETTNVVLFTIERIIMIINDEHDYKGKLIILIHNIKYRIYQLSLSINDRR